MKKFILFLAVFALVACEKPIVVPTQEEIKFQQDIKTLTENVWYYNDTIYSIGTEISIVFDSYNRFWTCITKNNQFINNIGAPTTYKLEYDINSKHPITIFLTEIMSGLDNILVKYYADFENDKLILSYINDFEEISEIEIYNKANDDFKNLIYYNLNLP